MADRNEQPSLVICEKLHDYIEQLFGWDIFGKKTSMSQSTDNNY